MKKLSIKSLSRIAILASFAVLLNILELPIPKPLPWVKLGLANLITVIVLIEMGMLESFLVIILRIFITSIVIGNFFTIGFFLSLSGGIAALSSMNFMKHFSFSIYSISIMGALIHNLVQLLIVWSLIVKHNGIFINLPFMMVAAIICGTVIGIISDKLISRNSIKKLFKTE